MNLEQLFGGALLGRPDGPTKWCRTCSRRHKARACNLVTVTRIAKSGKKVKRMAHPQPAKSKTRARKT